MNNITCNEAIENHRLQWIWIAKETLSKNRIVTEADYFNEFPLLDRPANLCYCCEYSEQQTINEWSINCDPCPIAWNPNGRKKCSRDIQEKGVYRVWFESMDINTRAAMALVIACLPSIKEIVPEDMDSWYMAFVGNLPQKPGLIWSLDNEILTSLPLVSNELSLLISTNEIKIINGKYRKATKNPLKSNLYFIKKVDPQNDYNK